MPVYHSGASTLPLVEVDTHSEELRDDKGFIGDRANRRAFNAVLDDWRGRMKAIVLEDPFSDEHGGAFSKKQLDRMHRSGDPLQAGILHTAIEEFAHELADITLRFLRTKNWRGTQRIVVGGGLSRSRVGEVIVGRASVLVKAAGHPVRMATIRHDPDEAALIGAAHLVPTSTLSGNDAMLAVDIGGSNIRAGLVELRLDKAADLSASRVHKLELWRYADERKRPTREESVSRLVAMLERLLKRARKEKLTLAPLLGVACPGAIDEDGAILRGGQNLPGNWESASFNLANALTKAIPTLGAKATQVVIHNDAVVQGLSEVPFMRDVERWGVLTIGTGLGNARFTNRGKRARTGRAPTKAKRSSRRTRAPAAP
ncbi:hypothetical protein P2318_24985 [Myxococcaceae bacterium GXIMD 01537]